MTEFNFEEELKKFEKVKLLDDTIEHLASCRKTSIGKILKPLKETFDVHRAQEVDFSEVFNESKIWPELNLILKSMLKVERINLGSETRTQYGHSLIISRDLGLKLYRNWGAYSPLRWIMKDRILSYKEGRFEILFSKNNRELTIDFAYLSKSSQIDESKLEKFLEFFEQAVKLKKKTLDEANDSDSKMLYDILHDLKTANEYTNLQEIKNLIVSLRDKLKYYDLLLYRYNRFRKKVQELEGEIKEFNKPFRVLQKLKENE